MSMQRVDRIASVITVIDTPGETDEFSGVSRSKNEARKFYDAISSWYDLLAYSSEKKYVNEFIDDLSVRDGMNVLEIGFGTGHAVESLIRSVGERGRVVGIDISPKMRSAAEKLLGEKGLSDRAELVVGDAASLPFQEDEFDLVFLSFTLELFDTPEIPEVLGEIKRVTRVGGELGILGLSSARKRKMDLLYDRAHRCFPKYLDCRPIPISRLVEEAGFHNVSRSIGSMWGLTIETVKAQLSKK